MFARVHSFAQTPSKVSVGVEVPSGWKAPEPVNIEFSGAGDRLVHLTVMPPAKITPGNYELKTYAKRGDEMFETSRAAALAAELFVERAGREFPFTFSPSRCRNIYA